MNRCKYCGKPLTLTPEYDTCMECQGRIMREATTVFSTGKIIDLVDVEVGDKKLDLTRIREAKKYTIYDLVLEYMQEMESIPHMKDILSVKSNQNTWERIKQALKRAKIEHELLELYKTLFYEIMTIPNVYNNVVHGDNDIWYRIKPKIENREKELEALK